MKTLDLVETHLAPNVNEINRADGTELTDQEFEQIVSRARFGNAAPCWTNQARKAVRTIPNSVSDS